MTRRTEGGFGRCSGQASRKKQYRQRQIQTQRQDAHRAIKCDLISRFVDDTEYFVEQYIVQIPAQAKAMVQLAST